MICMQKNIEIIPSGILAHWTGCEFESSMLSHASVLVDGLVASGSRSGSWHQNKVKVKVRRCNGVTEGAVLPCQG